MSQKIIQSILDDEKKLKEFSVFNGLAMQAAQEILKRMLEKPDISDEVRKYIFSADSSDNLKAFNAGEEKGYKRGHDAGFAKGAFLVLLTTVVAAGRFFFKK